MLKQLTFIAGVFGGIVISISAVAQQIVPSSEATLQSPDKKIMFHFYQKTLSPGKRMMYYTVTYKGAPVINESALDLHQDNQLSEKAMNLKVETRPDWCENLEIKGFKTTSKDTTWKPVWGEQSQVRDNYNQLTIETVKEDNPLYPMNIEVRAYNEGVTFHYFFPENVKGTYYNITSENTEFSLPEGTQAWYANWAQGPYSKIPVNQLPDEAERPLTLELSNGTYVALAEAEMVDYARTKFILSKSKPNTLQTKMFEGAQLVSPCYTPWRAIMIGDKPGDLIERSYFILNLNPPNKIANTGWIKPGKIMRVMNMTTAESKAIIDFGTKYNLQHILYDFKWYGNGYSVSADASKVVIPELDLPEVIRYAKSKNIGVWLYVNQQAAMLQSDSLFAIYEKWGVAGVKLGFVQVGSHRWTTWVEDMIHLAARHHIMLDIHDEWRPTGEQRTWPNLLTAEGIRGNEEMPDATQTVILPFTRLLAGPADNTFCYFDKRLKVTHAHQLALSVAIFSPLQTLYWYDNPADYHDEPELQFWKDMPTTWDETRVINGTPGEYITTARRSGNNWFIGAVTGNDARSLKLPLSFLQKGKKYQAIIYSDDPAIKTASHVKVEHKTVTASTVLDVKLLASGGEAISIKPLD